MSYWWLSFCDGARPAGKRFLGVVIVQAPSFTAALVLSHVLGCNPGGEVQGGEVQGIKAPGHKIPPQYLNRLLTRAEAEHVDTEVGNGLN